jgi:hypothetical protein
MVFNAISIAYMLHYMTMHACVNLRLVYELH